MCEKWRKYFQLKALFVLLILNATTKAEKNCIMNYGVPFECKTEKQFELNEISLNITCHESSTRTVTLPMHAKSFDYAIKGCTLDEGLLQGTPYGPFSKVESLVFKECSTRLVSMRNDTLAPFKNLKVLWLDNNHLRDLPEELFSNNKELRYFIMRQNILIQLPGGLLKNLPKLKQVNITGGVDNMPEDLFINSTQIREIYLNNTKLRDLPEKLLQQQSELRVLHLVGNKLRELPEKLLANSTQLELFHLENITPIPSLPKDLLANLTNLRIVYISCGLETLSADNFNNAAHIEQLTLTGNKLSTLPPGSFSKLPQLKFLNLTANGLTSLPEELLQHCKELANFTLRERRSMEVLPARFLANLTQLRVVELSCGLSNISADLLAYSIGLEQLTLSHNKLTSLPEELLWHQPKLKGLYLIKNRLIDLPFALLNANSALEYFTLKNQRQIKSLPIGFFSRAANLLELQIRCDLQSPPFALNKFPKLTVLNLSNNNLKMTELRLPVLPQLQILNLTQNQLSGTLDFFDLLYKNLPENITIDLSYNKISVISYTDFIPLKLRKAQVDLSHNQIKRVTWFEDTNFNAVGQFIMNLANNPIDCNCKLLGFKLYTQDGCPQGVCPSASLQTLNMKCQTPPNLRHHNFAHISPIKLLCAVNNASCPANCSCHQRPYDEILLVNCTGAGLHQIPQLTHLPELAPLGLSFTELDITHNNLTEFALNSKLNYANITKIDASHKQIARIVVEKLPPLLSHIDLSHNRLAQLNERILDVFSSSRMLKSLDLTNNSWSCNCDTLPLMKFIKINASFVKNLRELRCANSTRIMKLSIVDICPVDYTAIIIAALIGGVLLLLLITGLCFVYYRKKYNSLWNNFEMQ